MSFFSVKDVDRIEKAHSVAADEGWISKIDQLGLSSLCLFHDPLLSAAGETSSVQSSCSQLNLQLVMRPYAPS